MEVFKNKMPESLVEMPVNLLGALKSNLFLNSYSQSNKTDMINSKRI